MASDAVWCTGQSVRCVRWFSTEVAPEETLLVTGTCNNKAEKLSLWSYAHPLDGDPTDVNDTPLATLSTAHGITHVEQAAGNTVAATGIDGSLCLAEVVVKKDYPSWELRWVKRWGAGGRGVSCTGEPLHRLAANSVAVCGEKAKIATVGQDGALCVLSTAEDDQPFYKAQDTSSLLGVQFVSCHEVVTCGSYVRQWDTRQRGHTKEFDASVDHSHRRKIGFESVSLHRDLFYICAGSTDGDVVVWDLRDSTRPLSLHPATHRSAVCWETHFALHAPNHVVSCGASGHVVLTHYARMGEVDARLPAAGSSAGTQAHTLLADSGGVAFTSLDQTRSPDGVGGLAVAASADHSLWFLPMRDAEYEGAGMPLL